jgi:hypothetical protein
MKACEFKNCQNKHHSKGLCKAHYVQRQRGKPLTSVPKTSGTITENNKQNLINRLLNKVEKTEKGCWEWKGTILSVGYGVMNVNSHRTYTHRLSYLLFKGEIPDEQDVCHKCDNRICVNPDHLWLGSRSDNIHDMVNKNRQAKGESIGSSKLVTEEVLQIRSLYSKGTTKTKLARKFDVSISAISMIVNRERWRHI